MPYIYIPVCEAPSVKSLNYNSLDCHSILRLKTVQILTEFSGEGNRIVV